MKPIKELLDGPLEQQLSWHLYSQIEDGLRWQIEGQIEGQLCRWLRRRLKGQLEWQLHGQLWWLLWCQLKEESYETD